MKNDAMRAEIGLAPGLPILEQLAAGDDALRARGELRGQPGIARRQAAALTLALGYFCALPLPPLLGIDRRWGVAGLTLSAGIAGLIEFVGAFVISKTACAGSGPITREPSVSTFMSSCSTPW